MRISTLLTAAAFAAAFAAPALAQPPAGGGRGLPDFATQDANKDGKVTKEELTASLPEQAKQFADRIFDTRDANKDGSISKVESDAAPAGRGGGGGAPAPQ